MGPTGHNRRVGAAISRDRVDPDNLLFAQRVRTGVREMDRLHDAAAIYRSHPELRAPERVAEAVTRALRAL